jgi:hypothetical protein
MAYNYVRLAFEGDSLKAIQFNSDFDGKVHFEKGLSSTSPADVWVKELGEPAARKDFSENNCLLIYTSAKATMTLQFFDGGMETIELATPDFPAVNKFLYPKGFIEAANVFKNAPTTI